MIKVVSQNHLGVVNYVVSTVAEIAYLPKRGEVAQGSTAFVIQGALVYMYDEEGGDEYEEEGVVKKEGVWRQI